jgi:putative solute:sodium symporter small subunit
MHEYWKKNKTLIAVLLTIWAIVSYGFAILGAKALYGIKLGSLPVSFWWAQQGSMFVFVILIFTYAIVMDRLDRKYGVGEDE